MKKIQLSDHFTASKILLFSLPSIGMQLVDNTYQVADGYAETESRLREMLALYQDRMSRPYVMGKDLMAAGAEPGPRFTDALTYARKLRLAGVPKEEQLAIDHGHVNFAQAA